MNYPLFKIKSEKKISWVILLDGAWKSPRDVSCRLSLKSLNQGLDLLNAHPIVAVNKLWARTICLKTNGIEWLPRKCTRKNATN